ncbi:hypothetical protein B0H10DRAFT_1960784 [Mycena sp. CBHHK59/15]|nr:hypothetical protein B0H10DRAFT_1960784 [Mycena sp. CBHHK59/15]
MKVQNRPRHTPPAPRGLLHLFVPLPPHPTPATCPATISELHAVVQADPDASPSSNLDLDALFMLRRGAPMGREGTGVWCRQRRDWEQSERDQGRWDRSGAHPVTLILEKIPSPRDYATVLNEEQRVNVRANGKDLLLQLGHPKAMLVERYERYTRSPAASTDAIPVFMLPRRGRVVARAAQRSCSRRFWAAIRICVWLNVPTANVHVLSTNHLDTTRNVLRILSHGLYVHFQLQEPCSSHARVPHIVSFLHVHRRPDSADHNHKRHDARSHVTRIFQRTPAANPSASQPKALLPSFVGGSEHQLPDKSEWDGPDIPIERRGVLPYAFVGGIPSSSNYASSSTYPSSVHNTPTPGSMPLRPVHMGGEHEYDGTDLETGWEVRVRVRGLPDTHMTPTSTNAHNDIIPGVTGLGLSGAPFDDLPPTGLTSVAYLHWRGTCRRTQGYILGT